jgi:hypothetical protein
MNCPASHLVQKVEPFLDVSVEEQFLHLSTPGVSDMNPALQSLHFDTFVLPTSLEYFPGLH